jgi:type I restriction enzyme, S subunit
MNERIPSGWVWTTLGEVCEIGAGNPAPQNESAFNAGGRPFVRVRDLGKLSASDVYLHDTKDHLTEAAASNLVLFPRGVVLFTKSGMSTLLNQRAILGRDMCVVSHIGTCIPSGDIPSEWVYYWLKTVDFKDLTHATTLPSLPLPKVKAIGTPLPPLPEQRRIVAKIEELFSQLDAGVEELRKAKAQLKRYRQSVLKAAFEGKLTEEWRKKNLTTKTPRHKEGKKPETAQELLARVREERKKALGKKYKEPPSLDTSELPEPPEGWTWTRLDALAAYEPHAITDGPFGSNLKTSHYTESGPRVIRLQNIGDGAFVDAFAHISQAHYEELARHKVLAGDLVIAALGEELPRSCVIPPSVGPAIVKADCIRFNPNRVATSAQFLNVILNAEPLKKMVSDIIHGVGRPRLNQQQVKALPVPLPPVAEQEVIVAEVEQRLSIADAEEKVIEAALKQAARLRQSILKRAFEGRLVPQDPSDEPAERLLERIRAERAKHAAGQPRGRGRRTATAGK